MKNYLLRKIITHQIKNTILIMFIVFFIVGCNNNILEEDACILCEKGQYKLIYNFKPDQNTFKDNEVFYVDSSIDVFNANEENQSYIAIPLAMNIR